MDSLNPESDVIADLLGEHLLRRAEEFAPDERVARWATLEAVDRLSSRERERTRIEAAALAARLGRAVLAARLESSLPTSELLTRAAGVSGGPFAVTRAAFKARSAPLVETAVAAGAGADLLEEVVDTWVALPPGTQKGDYLALPVIGDSMEPFLHPKDVVLVKLGSEVARDTVIVARTDDGYVVKYVSNIAGGEIELTSLGVSYPAITIPHAEHRVVGTVVARLRRAAM